ncbi:MAG: monovalent cation/H+ antiporter subunit D family protein [Hyphomicrobiaceae bacterium]|nr:monovalent cation/H+ antiporter subunit D family protein [Hyphomicrobiaceae bacterium]
MKEHLPALIVVVPMVVAAAVAMTRNNRVAWAASTIVTWALFVFSAMLLAEVTNVGEISYSLGGWPPPYGIEYRVDIVNALILMLVSGIGAVVMPYALRAVDKDIHAGMHPWFYCTYLLCLCGLLGMTVTGDAFNIFVFMEISSLATYVLIALGRRREALLSAYQYLVMGTIGATLYVIGVGLLYIVTGSLNLSDIAGRLGPAMSDHSRSVMAGIAFIFTGLSLKLALFPLHFWLPNAYAFAPSFATIFLAATATKVAIYVFLRLYFSVFGAAISFSQFPVVEVILVLSLAAIFTASFLAIYEDSIVRMLAYSSVAQIGYITLGVAIANKAGLTGSIVHLVNHGLMKALLFAAVGAIIFRVGTDKLSKISGLGFKMPVTTAAFVVGGLSIIGVPSTVGFVSKWYLGVGAVNAGLWPVTLAIMVSSLLAVLYIGRVIEVVYFNPVCERCVKVKEPPLSMLAPIILLAIATVYFGLDTSFTGDIAIKAAEQLLEGLKQ